MTYRSILPILLLAAFLALPSPLSAAAESSLRTTEETDFYTATLDAQGNL